MIMIILKKLLKKSIENNTTNPTHSTDVVMYLQVYPSAALSVSLCPIGQRWRRAWSLVDTATYRGVPAPCLLGNLAACSQQYGRQHTAQTHQKKIVIFTISHFHVVLSVRPYQIGILLSLNLSLTNLGTYSQIHINWNEKSHILWQKQCIINIFI